MNFVLVFLLVAAINIGLIFYGNGVAQRLFPTLETAGPGRRFLYRLLVLVIIGGSLIVTGLTAEHFDLW